MLQDASWNPISNTQLFGPQQSLPESTSLRDIPNIYFTVKNSYFDTRIYQIAILSRSDFIQRDTQTNFIRDLYSGNVELHFTDKFQTELHHVCF